MIHLEFVHCHCQYLHLSLDWCLALPLHGSQENQRARQVDYLTLSTPHSRSTQVVHFH